MIVVLNGPLGIGKSTLAEPLCERIDRIVMQDEDQLVAASPTTTDRTNFAVRYYQLEPMPIRPLG